MPASYPAALLPVAETCAGSLDVIRSQSMTQLWRAAFLLGIQPPTVHSIESYRIAKARLADMYAVDVDGAVEDYNADVREGNIIPAAHRLAFEVTSDLDARVPGRSQPQISFTIDNAWAVSKDAAGTQTRAVVLQHELARFGSPKETDLDIAFAGIAMAALYGVEHMQLGRCYHSPGKKPIYKWTKVLGDTEMSAYWERITRIIRKPREFVGSDLCETCTVRRNCPQWMLPAAHGGTPTYRKLTGQDPLAANDVSEIRRFVKSLREAADVAEGQLRTLKREGIA